MITFNYSDRLRSDIAGWRDAGLIDADTQIRLMQEVESARTTRSFASVVAILGAILIGAALITFVAANWDAMPKLMRLSVLVGSIWIAYGVAYFAYQKEHGYIADAFLVIGIAAFGASIFLIGQMFQLQGRNEDALLLWFAGAAATTLATRSGPALIFTVGLSIAWMMNERLTGDSIATFLSVPRFYWFLPVWFGLVAATWWVRSRVSAHLCSIGLLLWLIRWVSGSSYLFSQILPSGWFVVCLLLVLGACLLASAVTGRWLLGFETAGITYAMAGTLFLTTNLMFLPKQGSSTVRSGLEPLLGYDSQMVLFCAAVLLALALAVFLIYFVRNVGGTMLRDQLVYPAAIVVLPVLAFLVPWLGGNENIIVANLISSLYSFFLSIWAMRFGWRIGSKTMTAIGLVGFVAALLVSYDKLFGSLEMTALVYAFGGVTLIATSVWLFRSERRIQGGNLS